MLVVVIRCKLIERAARLKRSLLRHVAILSRSDACMNSVGYSTEIQTRLVVWLEWFEKAEPRCHGFAL